MNLLPGKFDTSKALIVGLRSWDKGMQERQKELGIKGLAPKETADNSSAIMEWLKSTGASKVVIHFDLDVIDPADMIAGVGVEPDGMKTEEVVRVINDIASEYDLVGLTIAEPMPRIAIKISNMLNQLPLLKEKLRVTAAAYDGYGYAKREILKDTLALRFTNASIELLSVAGGYSALLLRADSIGKELVYQKVFGLVIKECPAFLLCQTILADEESRAISINKTTVSLFRKRLVAYFGDLFIRNTSIAAVIQITQCHIRYVCPGNIHLQYRYNLRLAQGK